MQLVKAGQANTVSLPVAAKATGSPITSGTVNFYLIDRSTSKWFRGSDGTWQVAESIAGAATHLADGHWDLDLPSAAWTADHRYMLYATESGDLHVPVGEEVLCNATGSISGTTVNLQTEDTVIVSE